MATCGGSPVPRKCLAKMRKPLAARAISPNLGSLRPEKSSETHRTRHLSERLSAPLGEPM